MQAGSFTKPINKASDLLLLVMGLDLMFSFFLLLGLPIVHSAFSGMVFCSLLCAAGDGFRS